MNCDAVERENIIEQYLAGSLGPWIREEWEEHYFGCDRCWEQLEVWIAIEKPLRAMDAAIRAEIQSEGLQFRKRTTAVRSEIWTWGAATMAAALVLGAALWFSGAGRQPVANPETASLDAPWTDLGRLDPPAYAVPVLRGMETGAELQFLEAMKSYQTRDYPAAISGLQASLNADSNAVAPRFFLGASYLLAGRSGEGISELTKVAAEDSAFSEEARFCLAKGYLMEGKIADAIAPLRLLAATQGSFSAEAQRLLNLLAPREK
jgi:hypothetical protein